MSAVTDLFENLFGYELVKKVPDIEAQESKPSFVQKEQDDGAVTVAATAGYGTYVDLDGSVRNEAELISRYREMAYNPEVDQAINEVVNELVEIEDEDSVKIDLSNVNATDPIKEAIEKCFEDVLMLLNFNQQGYEIVRRWYVDGRINYHTVIDVARPTDGIVELRYVDPRKIRKIREITKKRMPGDQDHSVDGLVTDTRNEYYLYNDRGFSLGVANQAYNQAATGIKIAKDAIVQVTSGLTDVNGTMVLSYLHKAIRPLNILRSMEDAMVIYRISRAPERRVWYIDVGNLPKAKADQYVQSIVQKHRNRLTYNAENGQIMSDVKMTTMMEDYWLPRNGGGKGTQVETLPAGQNLSQMDDVLYFQKKLYGALSVPVSRLNSDDVFAIGRATEITRDEVTFGKFISRLRARFAQIFNQLLEKQVVLRGVMSIEDWQRLMPKVKYDFAHDNYFMEMKDQEVLKSRADVLQALEPYIGRYYSNKYICNHVLKQTDAEIEEQRAEIEEEKDDPIYSELLPGQQPPPPMIGPDGMPMDPSMAGPPPDGAPDDGSDPGGGPDGPDIEQVPQDDKKPKTQQRRDVKIKKKAE